MSTIQPDALSDLGLRSFEASHTNAEGGDELGQEEFLRLMTTQLANQDPLKPLENGEFLGELAQFSTVAGIKELSASFETLAQSMTQWQTLQGASLVGQEVLVPGQFAELQPGQALEGAIELTASASAVRIEILNAAGQPVQTLDLGAQAPGLHEFTWDGTLADGSSAPAGRYQIRATAQSGEATEAVSSLVSGEVSSVRLDSATSGLQLNVNGIGEIDLSQVRRIG